MMALVDERKQVKIYVTGGAKKAIEGFADQYDMTETGVASRVYERFGALPAAVQKWFIGLTDAQEGHGMRQFCAEMMRAVDTTDFVDVSRPRPPAPPAGPARNHSGRKRSSLP